jgi:hypothetical protein
MAARPNRTLDHAARIALAAMVMLLGFGRSARAQSMRAGGSIGVSLTILPPVATQPVRLVGFDVDRNGLATVRTTASASASASQIVMTSVALGSTVGSTGRRVATVVPSSGAATVRNVVDLGKSRGAESRQTVQLRLEYLTVAGT